MPSQPQSAIANRIRNLARKHDVAYVQTRSDALAHHMTRLADDHVELDEIERLLIALQRSGHLSRVEMVQLQASYLRETKLLYSIHSAILRRVDTCAISLAKKNWKLCDGLNIPRS